MSGLVTESLTRHGYLRMPCFESVVLNRHGVQNAAASRLILLDAPSLDPCDGIFQCKETRRVQARGTGLAVERPARSIGRRHTKSADAFTASDAQLERS